MTVTEKIARDERKANSKTTQATNGEPGKAVSKADRSTADVPANERRAALVKCLRKAKATEAAKGLLLEELAGRLKYTRFDAYGLVSGTSGKAGSSPGCLLATGHVQVANREDGLAVYLTKKGSTTDFKEVPFAKKAAAKVVPAEKE